MIAVGGRSHEPVDPHPTPRREGVRGAALGIVAIAGLVFASAPAAGAAIESTEPDGVFTDVEISEIRERMSDLEVDPELEDGLIDGLQDGVLPMSSTDAEPVDSFTEVDEGVERTVLVYADGSRRGVSRDLPMTGDEVPDDLTLTGCVWSGDWRVNCRVGISDLISEASFIIDWRPSVGSAQVRDMRAVSCNVSGGTCDVTGTVWRSVQSAAGPAWAEVVYEATLFGDVWHASGSFGIRAEDEVATTYH